MMAHINKYISKWKDETKSETKTTNLVTDNKKTRIKKKQYAKMSVELRTNMVKKKASKKQRCFLCMKRTQQMFKRVLSHINTRKHLPRQTKRGRDKKTNENSSKDATNFLQSRCHPSFLCYATFLHASNESAHTHTDQHIRWPRFKL